MDVQVQFVLVFGHSLNAVLRPNCWPFILAFAEGLHAILFFNMFFSFYRRVYWGQGAQQSDSKHSVKDKSQ